MALTPEELEERLLALEDRNKKLERRLRSGRGDPRIPLLATNFDVEDAIFPPAVRVYNSGALTITNNTNTTLTFDSERYKNTESMHSTSSNTDRLFAPSTGVFHISATIGFASNATGRRAVWFDINGVDIIAWQEWDTNQNSVTRMVLSTDWEVEAGQFARCRVFQSSGGDLDVTVNAKYSPEFSMRWVAPST